MSSALHVDWWRDDACLRRFVSDLVAAELSRLRPTSLISPAGRWADDVHLVRDLAVDSMEMVVLATALTEALHLHESGIEDRLLVRHAVGDWVAVAHEGLETFSDAMTFRTSGSADVPKRCMHRFVDLRQEVTELAVHLAGRRRVLSAVRGHHIYGFLWTALLPLELDLSNDSVVDVRGSLPSSVTGGMRDGDLVVGYPDFWRRIAESGATIPAGVVGITSTAPCPAALAEALKHRGLESLLQIYGSTETAGVGVRWSADEPYTLLSFWKRATVDGTKIVRTSTDGSTVGHVPQDTLEWTSDGFFRVTGRVDDVVQVAGVNVHPAKVRRVLMEHPDVADAAIRRMSVDEPSRLKAFIVPHNSRSSLELQMELEAWVAGRLSAPERPKAFTFGESIPTDAAGKHTDWRLA